MDPSDLSATMPTELTALIANLTARLQIMDEAYGGLQGNMTVVKGNMTDL